jgi:hypothetical protein
MLSPSHPVGVPHVWRRHHSKKAIQKDIEAQRHKVSEQLTPLRLSRSNQPRCFSHQSEMIVFT